MLNSRWFFLAALVSFSSLGAVSLQEKKLRVDSLMQLQSSVPSIAFDAYQRELGYEALGLDIDQRTRNETNLLAEKIKSQVLSAYQSALLEHNSPELAREEVGQEIEKDLEMASPEMRDELNQLATETLNQAHTGVSNQNTSLENVSVAIRREVQQRKSFLNKESIDPIHEVAPIANSSKDSEKNVYKNKKELLSSLISDRENSRWVSTANQTITTAHISKFESNISLQIKTSFLGVEIQAGPTISFKREVTTNASIMSEGLSPVLKNNGGFDRFKRDANGTILKKNGKAVKRYISFNCEADLKFDSAYNGTGGFKFQGLGGDVSYEKTYSNLVSFQSRRIAMPESVENHILNVKYLAELCHTDFLAAKINNLSTVRDSLHLMMRNVITNLVFVNNQTKCLQDNHCKEWFDKEVITLKKTNNTYHCVENTKDKYRFCQLRGKVGQNCSVVENKKLVSSGTDEYPCDWGLKCVKTSNESKIFNYTWTPAKGSCQK